MNATLKEILEGKTTDIYFRRAIEILRRKKKNPEVVAEVWAKKLPEKYEWGIFTGLSEAIELFKNKKVDVWALPEGSVFFEKEPVFTIKGKYLEFAELETPLLGFLCQASGISTKAARCKINADGRIIISFGSRRMHPSITPIIDRYAYIGGVDGVSSVLSAEKLNLKPTGTIPHSLILIFEDTEGAALAYDEVISKEIPRIILVDTFGDEKIEGVRLAESLKQKLNAIRIDTPSSRRGELKFILEETRKELDYRGFNNVGIFVSGGLDEYNIVELNPWASGYGIGTSISNAPTINFSLDLVEIEGKLIAKKGKISGKKEILECPHCGRRAISFYKKLKLKCDCGSSMGLLTKKFIEKGKLLEEKESIEEIRNRVLKELRFLNV